MTILIKPSAVNFKPSDFEVITVTESASDGLSGQNSEPVLTEMYRRVFKREELNKSFVDHEELGPMLVMTAVVKDSKPISLPGQTIYDDAGHELDFACSYGLGDRVVQDNFHVGGTDLNLIAEQRGTLGYTLQVEKSSSLMIGTAVNFVITPKNPGLVYATVKSCDVFKGDENDDGVTIIGMNSMGQDADMCVNPIINSQLQTFSSKEALIGSWTAFKWNTDRLQSNAEGQTLSCKIGLSKVHKILVLF